MHQFQVGDRVGQCQDDYEPILARVEELIVGGKYLLKIETNNNPLVTDPSTDYYPLFLVKDFITPEVVDRIHGLVSDDLISKLQMVEMIRK